MIKHPEKPLAVHTWDWRSQPEWETISEVINDYQKFGKIKITYIETGSDEHAIAIHSELLNDDEVGKAYSQHHEWESGINQDELNFDEAKRYLDEIRRQYTDIGFPGLAALEMTINPLLVRFEKGERTKDLFDEIMSLN